MYSSIPTAAPEASISDRLASSHVGSDAPEAPDELEDLAERAWGERRRRLSRRELRFELGLSLVVVAGSVLLVLASSSPLQIDLALCATVLAYAAASRVAYPLGAGDLVPTQPFLVALFALAPPAAVPLLVCVALALATLVEASLGRSHLERLSFTGGDAFHAVGPAVVLMLAGVVELQSAALPILAAAMAAQLACDLASSSLREWVVLRIRPRLQAGVIAQVYGVDLCLAPLGLLAVYALDTGYWAVLALVPLVVMLAAAARARMRGVARAHARLLALQRERTRLRLAVRRIGESLASNLDLDSLLAIVTQATVEALDAEIGRASTYSGTGRKLLPRVTVEAGTSAHDQKLFEGIEQRVLSRGETSVLEIGGRHAIGGRIEDRGELIGILVLAGGGRFERGQRELFEYLCGQAGVAAANILRHESLHQQALTDELTQLANHRRFQDVVKAAVERYSREGTACSLAFFDLDNFKALNDEHGHQLGDRVLRTVARCFAEHCRETDVPARYGGEEFGVVLEGASEAEAMELAERIRRAVAELDLLTAAGEAFRVSISAGIAELGSANPTKPALLAAADAALYAAKHRGRNNVCASSRLSRTPVPAPRIGVADGLPLALERGEFRLEFQPLMRLSTARAVAVEALVRWDDPRRGTLNPSTFIPAAEERGRINALGAWILHEATHSAAAWLERWPELDLAVNVSPIELAQDNYVQQVARTLELTGFPIELLILELTETALLHESPQAIEQIVSLRSMGVRIALDDFGTGHAGLQSLLALPTDIVKIAQPFVTRLDGPIDKDRVLCESMIELLQRAGLDVVAEGVERDEQRMRLAALGVDLAQGFLFAEPLSSDALETWLEHTAPLALASSSQAVPQLVS